MFERFFGIYLMGITVKIMDDYLDKDIDKITKQWNITLSLQRAIMPYTLLIVVLSMLLNQNESLSFFIASYTLGMGFKSQKKLPSRLYPWQESILILSLGIYYLGIKEILTSILLIIFIQIIDDIIDYKKEYSINRNNTRRNLGLFNSLIITVIIFLVLIKTSFLKTVYFILAVLFIYFTFYLLEKFNKDDFDDN